MDNEVHKVVAIPDSFKGTLSAREVAGAMRRGVERAATTLDIHVDVSEIPFADGGEGTLEAVLAAWGTAAQACDATDSLGRPIRSHYGVSPDGKTGLIEAAQANGLAAVSDVPLRPREATTRGVGAMVRAALDQGVQEILLTAGGSATTDGGTGMLRELGMRFLDKNGNELPDGGGCLVELATIDVENVDPRAFDITWKIAADVTNPLTGPHGAAHVFGPQKGATPEDVEVLDAALANMARVAEAVGGQQTEGVPGLGAAGGIAALLHAFFRVELEPGWQMVSQALGAPETVGSADLVLTGEGRFDSQSIDGKVIYGVRQFTPPAVPLVVLAGQVGITSEDLERSGVTAAFSIARGPSTLEEIAPQTAELVEWNAYQIARFWLS
ncbi:MAG: glycerate kinase [Ancrocorticia sp.]|uniref:glycerate kinase n=1 Tax=Ancrocorticia sp. TaxID=2593684 RepID=UPI003F927690